MRDRDDSGFLAEDAADRRTALEEAVMLVDGLDNPHHFGNEILQIAESFYEWLRRRPSIQPVRLVITAGPVEDQP